VRRGTLEQVHDAGGSVPRRRRDKEVDVVWLNFKGKHIHTMLGCDGRNEFLYVGPDGSREDPTAILGDPDDVVIEIVDSGSRLASSHNTILAQVF
jgi:hypothetical protein